MGGNRTLSGRFNIKTKEDILKAARDSGITISGVGGKSTNRSGITNRNLAFMSEVTHELIKLKNEFGLSVDGVSLRTKSDSKALFQHATGKKSGLTFLVIPRATLDRGYQGVKKDIAKSHKGNSVVAKNIRQALIHELGHEVQNVLKKTYPLTYKKLVKDLYNLQKKEGSNHLVSKYAHRKSKDDVAKNYKGNMSDTISESLVHILSRTKSRTGQDSVNLVHRVLAEKGIIKNLPEYKLPKSKGIVPKTTRKVTHDEFTKMVKRDLKKKAKKKASSNKTTKAKPKKKK